MPHCARLDGGLRQCEAPSEQLHTGRDGAFRSEPPASHDHSPALISPDHSALMAGRWAQQRRCTMWDALNRAESYRDLAEECRRLAANSLSPQMRNRFSLMADDYSTLAEGRTSLRRLAVLMTVAATATAN